MKAMEEDAEKYLFEAMPVPKAVATLAIPNIISQVVTMIYNLADTFFVGQIGDPLMVAAVSLVSPWFNLLTALGNLFGLGGSSLVSRMMGAQNHEDIKYVSVFSIWGGTAVTLLFSWPPGAGSPIKFSGSKPGYLWIRPRVSPVGSGSGRRANHGEPGPRPSAAH